MPLIPYQCDNCDHYFEITQTYTAKRKKKCPKCKQKTLRQVYDAPHITGTPVSLGMLAEKNTREMGKYALEAKYHQDTIEKNAVKLETLKAAGVVKPDATELPKDQLNYNKLKHIIKSPTKTKKYIEEGKT